MVLLDQHDNIIRLSMFVGVFILMALLETAMPRKQRTQARTTRWLTNWLFVIMNTAALRVSIGLFIPLLAIGMATIANDNEWGLFSLVLLPLWIEVIISIIALDMLIYAQHIAFHKIPVLWRFHQIHHADRDFDVTTGVRFHPVEIIVSMAYKLVCIIVLGPSAFAVLIFELLLNASSLFNHANFRLPLFIDRIIRYFFVTPDMHRVHHSIIRTETDSNYGFCLAVWDRLFKTYIAQPQQGHQDMIIGVAEYQDKKTSSLWWSIKLPFIAQHDQTDLTTQVDKHSA